MKYRILLESAVFGIVAGILYFAWPVIQGYWMTVNYVPDVISTHGNVEYLESQVSFGKIGAPNGWYNVAVFLLPAAIYGLNRWAFT
ncbi:hypothetical protein [Paenibacillus sp. DMB20]|uniref:hypothetical protein n=1 Tax=Paenibacillus sp. DMB20 TaxID=1642570 RepID=UPI000627D93B|nr:hypothetical protein [Paenibacillus sp. DMB20]KKO54425.1 hypothetical protein XI25_06230 [Paenibacillus sp. DMB20]